MKCSVKKHHCYSSVVAAMLLMFLISAFSGCAAGKGAGQIAGSDVENQPPLKSITSLKVLEDSGVPEILIEGNQKLTYTSAKQSFPPTVLLYFPETGLDLGETPNAYETEGQHAVIRSVKASEVPDDAGRKTTQIEVVLNSDVTYEIRGEDASVSVLFLGDAPSRSTEAGSQSMTSVQSDTASMQTATRLHSVYATKMDDSMKVFVGADGAITNYKAFTIESPPRIIFDIFNLQSPYKNEKQVKVDSPWVGIVRYFGYPDRLRLVLETKKQYLTAFSAYPVDNGLLIHVGKDAAAYRGGESSSHLGQPMEAAIQPRSQAKDTANRLQSIYATQLPDSTMVTLRGDGQIADFGS